MTHFDLANDSLSVIENLTYIGSNESRFFGVGNLADNVIKGGNATDPDKGDWLYGDGGNDTLIGLDGNDHLFGEQGHDFMLGGNGDDEFTVDNGTEVGGDVVIGDTGYDQVWADASVAATGFHLNLFTAGTPLTEPVNRVPNTSAAMEVELVHGSTGADVIDASRLGASEGLRVDGLVGNDRFVAGAGYDTFYGGADSDTIVLSGRRADYTLVPDAGGPNFIAFPGWTKIVHTATGSFDWIHSVETVEFADGAFATADLLAPPAQNIVGTEGDDTLVGTAAADHIQGLGGNDKLIGKEGADVLDGGAGIDTASYADSPAGVTVNLATGAGLGGDAEGDTFIGIEHAIGSAFDDTFQGGTDRGQFLAGDGADTMIGGSWYDWFEGGNGNDTFVGTGGYMVMFGGDGADLMTGSLDNGNYFDGGAGNDVMTGGNMLDYMADVTGGDDIMHGGGGDDVMVDHYGVNKLYGEGGKDTIYSSSNQGSLLDGGADDDFLYAYFGGNTLLGGAGNDILQNGEGGAMNFFTGGADADTFVYSAGVSIEANVTVTDFQDGVDRIGLRDQPFEQLTITDTAEGAVIEYYDTSPMLLAGISASQITQEDFLLV